MRDPTQPPAPAPPPPSHEPQAPLPPGPAQLASTLRLRADPPRVMRLSRKALMVLGLTAAAGIGGSLIYALKPTSPRQSTELYNTESRATPDTLARVPKDYGQAPKLGPPLPGDLGRPIVAAQQRAGDTSIPPPSGPPSAAATLAANAAQVAHQQAMQERDTARTSKLFLSSGAPGGGETAGGSAISGLTAGAAGAGATAPAPAEVAAGNGQSEKRTFLKGEIDHHTESAERLTAPSSPYVVQAGSVIAAALITGIRSDLPGQITAQVTQAVYDSLTGRTLLIPQGSRLVGEYDSQVAFGQERVLLAWTRLILPDGRSITLERQPGADAAGYSGLEDGVDNHWGKLFKAAILSTFLSVGAESGTSQNENNLAQAVRAGAANSISQTGQQIVEHELNVQPTLTIRPGYPVRVIVTRDLVLEPAGRTGR